MKNSKTIRLLRSRNLRRTWISLVSNLALVSIGAFSAKSQSYVWESVAGGAGTGNLDGFQGYAQTGGTRGMTKDSAGNLYFVTNNYCVKKVTPGGQVTALAGLAGSAGSTDGTGSAARFGGLNFIAIDSSGNLYVTDIHLVRKITSSGVVTTLAGQATGGYTNGTGSAAKFNFPLGVTVDSTGNLYVADSYNFCIRKVTSAGVVTLHAGNPGNYGTTDGSGLTAKFTYPGAIGIDSSGNLYVSDSAYIRKIASGTSTVSTLSIPSGSVSVAPSGNMAIGTSEGIYLANSTTVLDKISTSPEVGLAYYDGTNAYGIGKRKDIVKSVYKPAGYGWSDLAGTPGITGTSNGIGPAAGFNRTYGMAVDNSGNTYVADAANNVVRKITPAGLVSVYAGAIGVAGTADGVEGLFEEPGAVALDGSGNLYVTDALAHTIRKVAPNGYITTIAGTAYNAGIADGIGASATFNGPYGIAVTSLGIFVADSGSHTIRRISNGSYNVQTIAGLGNTSGSSDGVGSAARFDFPTGITYCNGYLYVADYNNSTIRKLGNITATSATISTFAGVAGAAGSVDGAGSAARFNGPFQLATGTSGELYASDYGTSKIRRISYSGLVSTVSTGSSSLGSVGGLAVSLAGELIVNDCYSSLVKGTPGSYFVWSNFAGDGTGYTPGNSDGTGSSARFEEPWHICPDPSGSAMWMVDRVNYTARYITTSGVVTSPLIYGGSAPKGITINAAGSYVYFACDNEQVIYKTNYLGSSLFSGSSYSSGSANGSLLSARYSEPTSIATDSSGNMYVADSFNYTIRKISTSGTVSTFAGSPGVAGFVDGTGTSARFYYPVAVAVDTLNNVYVTDQNVIRKITPAGVVSTICGSPTQYYGSADGPGGLALFESPQGLWVDSAGNIFVADSNNRSIRWIKPTGSVSTISTPGFFGPTLGITRIGSDLYVTDPYQNRLAKGTFVP